MSLKIKTNKAKCKKCNDIIESKNTNDFIRCSCGSIAVDGGLEYIKRIGETKNIIEMSEYQENILLQDLKYVNKDINIEEYIEFRELVKQNMEYPEWLGDFSKDDLINMLNNNCIIWIYYLNNEPICSMMLIPSTEKAIKKFELDLNYKEVVDYGPMFVNPKYVGNGLQYQMLKELDNYCFKLGYKYAVGTIHPDNIYSINNLLKDNFKLIRTKEFTRGIRNIYLKNL